jgi:hypothetical protein
MAMDFPNSPVVGQTFSSGSRTWVWTGTTWDSPTPGGTGIVGSAGGTFTGPIYGPNLPQSDNAIINGAFDIWQRGVSTSITTVSNTYTSDRWVTTLNQRTSGTLVVRQNTADKQSTDNYCLEIDATGVVTTSVLFHTQILETKDVVPLRGKTVTLSFYAKVASGSGTYLAVVRDGTDTDYFPSTSATQTETSNTVTTSWQRFTVTHTVQAGANSICVRFTTPFSFAGKVFFSQVQLEAGSVATPFRRNAPSIQGELAACQRYYWRNTALGDTVFATGAYYSSTQAWFYIPFPVVMRTAPSSGGFSNVAQVNVYANSTVKAATSYAAYTGNSNGFGFNVTTSAATTGIACFATLGTSGNYLEYSAEL